MTLPDSVCQLKQRLVRVIFSAADGFVDRNDEFHLIPMLSDNDRTAYFQIERVDICHDRVHHKRYFTVFGNALV